MSTNQRHRDVGAYALGVLDPADSFRFEEHLADCATCAVRLSEFAALESTLAAYAHPGAGVVLAERPTPGLLDRLLDRVEAGRRQRGRRRMRLVAAAAALIIAGPAAALALQPGAADGDGDGTVQRYAATDPASGVSASVALRERGWGSGVGLELARVKGPLTCELIAIGKDGEEQTVTTWAVPEGGYGMPGVPGHEEPLRTEGGAALSDTEIDRFEVRTLDGRRLVTIEA
ncbi:zf-HC2 domain-containing protein [Streptomyces sp. ISL-100]|uniref:zf-HC2 domain-containing protein n=1 Tax=Streptomyces sp. ISL-100 TaxID=2819173 RepID=UPI001BE9B3BB|nr:zf-HC2 domain-containing protein [Streptomyces sp. ISL-100]MBT2398354.1 zf-HC2 domain-containing protein [Streptomyces sp. ISL-100]